MSTASALLSMIAPAAPTPSQGATDAGASALDGVFEGLLASMAGAAPDGDSQGENVLLTEQKDAATDAAAMIVAAPVQTPPPPTPPLLLVAGTDLSAVTNEDAPAPSSDVAPDGKTATAPLVRPDITPDTASPLTQPPAPTPDLTAKAALPGQPLVQPQVQPEAPAETTPAAKPVATEPQVRPAADIASDAAPAIKPQTDQPQVRPAADVAPAVKATGEAPEVRPDIRPETKATLTDAPQVRPAVQTEPAAKTAIAEPQVRPAAERADPRSFLIDLSRVGRLTANTQIPLDLLRRVLPIGGLQQQPGDVAPVDPAQPTGGAAIAAEPVIADTAKGAAPAPLTQPPVSAETTAKTADPRPQVQPAAAPKAADPAPAEPQTLPEAPVELTEAAQPVAPETTQPTQPTPDAPRATEAPNLRALAERATRPVETNAAVDTAAPSTPATTTPVTATAQTAASPSTAIPSLAEAARPTAEAAPTDIAAANSTDPAADTPVEAPAPEAAPSAQTAQSAREALPSTLSRTAIDATAQIAAQILRKLEGRSSHFEMALTPDDLGRVDVKLDIDAEGRLAARLAFDNPAAAADLKGRVDELRRQLEQQGFQLSDDAIEFTQRDSGSSAFDRGQDSRQSQERGQSRAFAEANRLNTEADVLAQPPRWQALSLTPAGVDMKV